MRILSLPLAFASLAIAAVPHKFTAGTAAKADSVNANFEYLDNALKAKANQAGLDSLVSRVNSSPTVAGKASQGSVDTLKQLVSTKADTSELSAVKKSLSGLATTSSLTDALKLKANQAGLDSVKQANASQDTKISALQAAAIDPSKYATKDTLKNFVGTGAISDMATKTWAIGALAPISASTDIKTLQSSITSLSTDISALKTGKAEVSTVTALSATVDGKAEANWVSSNFARLSGKDLSMDSTASIHLGGSGVSRGYRLASILSGASAPGGWSLGMGAAGASVTDEGFAFRYKPSQADYTILQLSPTAVHIGGKSQSNTVNLSVSGSIYSGVTELAVPDYVFEPTYKLAPLSEVEAFTQQYKHLPDVPSAADLAKGGLDLTEMNLTLLKKVEELTLHAIAQQKQIEAQNTRIQSLESKLSATP